MHVNKVSHVTTIDRVAIDLGESIDFLYDAAMGLDIEDGVIWVYGPGDEQVMAFTDCVSACNFDPLTGCVGVQN